MWSNDYGTNLYFQKLPINAFQGVSQKLIHVIGRIPVIKFDLNKTVGQKCNVFSKKG